MNARNFFSMILVVVAAFSTIACAHEYRSDGSEACQISDLNYVFENPLASAGKIFCGNVIGVPNRTGIYFYPMGYEYSGKEYDFVMFIDNRSLSDRLRLSQPRPFRIHLEGIIRLADECFSSAAVAGEIQCIPVHHPINLQVRGASTPIPIQNDQRQPRRAPL